MTSGKNKLNNNFEGLVSNYSNEESTICSICLQPFIHPCKLPCNHVFCFLCLKGLYNQSFRCALCRSKIPSDYFENPNLVTILDHVDLANTKTISSTSNKEKESIDSSAEHESYMWYYEGNKGWWQYDERTNYEIEKEFNSKSKSFQILIAGSLYIIDFEKNLQTRVDNQAKKRRIKRDIVTAQKKGVAGILFNKNSK